MIYVGLLILILSILLLFISKYVFLQDTDESKSINKLDLMIIGVIILIYSAIALFNLGNHRIPETSYEINNINQQITINFNKNEKISKISYFLGNYNDIQFELQSYNDVTSSYEKVTDFSMSKVFQWGALNTDIETNSIKLICKSTRASIRELVFTDQDGNILKPENKGDYSNMFDEASLYEGYTTYKNSSIFDEIYHARTAYEYINGLISYETVHPPLGKILIALGMKIFGVNPFGWRITGTVFGILMIPLLYLLSKRFFKETWVSTLVTVLFTFDFMHFTQTRIATIDVFITFFVMLMYYFMYRYLETNFNYENLKKTFIPLGLCGISMGLGVATKWTGVYAAFGLFVLFCWHMIKTYLEYRKCKRDINEVTNGIKNNEIVSNFKKKFIYTILFCIVFFIVIPICIYLLSYIPYNDGYSKGVVEKAVNSIKYIFKYHTTMKDNHPFSSRWYEWPMMIRPVWYFILNMPGNTVETISAFGNPLVWWPGIICFSYILYLSIAEKDKKALVLVFSYLTQLLPWIFVKRTMFIYHYFPSVPFVALIIGYTMSTLSKKKKLVFGKIKMTKERTMKICVIYTIAALFLFVIFYPAISGYPVSRNYILKVLKWLPSWNFVA